MQRVPTLDCQTCGKPLRELTLSEAAMVAANPHNYIVDCYTCARERMLHEVLADDHD
jgi:hypothetical protein